MNLDILIYELLPILDIETLKEFACTNKTIYNAIKKKRFWKQLCDRDFMNDEDYDFFVQMENRPTWRKFYSRFYLMRKYQVYDPGPSFQWKGIYTLGYSWSTGTYVVLTEMGGTIVHINKNRLGISWTPGDLQKHFSNTNGTYIWLDSLKMLVKDLEKHKQSTNFKITSGGEYYDENNDDDADEIYLIKDKMNIIRELRHILKVAKFTGYRFKSASSYLQ